VGSSSPPGTAVADPDVADTVRRRPPAVRAQAAPLAAHHPSHPHAHHYPPRHRITWALRWVGMVLILVIAVV
jgi:hypothetical protein